MSYLRSCHSPTSASTIPTAIRRAAIGRTRAHIIARMHGSYTSTQRARPSPPISLTTRDQQVTPSSVHPPRLIPPVSLHLALPCYIQLYTVFVEDLRMIGDDCTASSAGTGAEWSVHAVDDEGGLHLAPPSVPDRLGAPMQRWQASLHWDATGAQLLLPSIELGGQGSYFVGLLLILGVCVANRLMAHAAATARAKATSHVADSRALALRLGEWLTMAALLFLVQLY